jgi:hypothetical protein
MRQCAEEDDSAEVPQYLTVNANYNAGIYLCPSVHTTMFKQIKYRIIIYSVLVCSISTCFECYQD